jgi:LmbE family N-acetylglucosaminyl deacetylase
MHIVEFYAMNTSTIFAFLLSLFLGFSFSQFHMFASGPKILIVTAHPDDETAFAATIYKVTHDLNGLADILLVTNGEGGYKYSTLAEDIYGRELTDEQSGRKALPTIRKKELMAGGEYIGLRDYFFMDQQDAGYTLDADSVLNIVWDTSIVIRKIKELHGRNNYDYVFTLLPVSGTHGHHKAASILALRAVKSIASEARPIIVGCSVTDSTKLIPDPFLGLPGFPETAMNTQLPIGSFNRLTPFGFQQKLNYQIVVNWLIAEHKSQGAMQLAMGKGQFEQFWDYAVNGNAGKEKILKLAELLRNAPLKEYQQNK